MAQRRPGSVPPRNESGRHRQRRNNSPRPADSAGPHRSDTPATHSNPVSVCTLLHPCPAPCFPGHIETQTTNSLLTWAGGDIHPPLQASGFGRGSHRCTPLATAIASACANEGGGGDLAASPGPSREPASGAGHFPLSVRCMVSMSGPCPSNCRNQMEIN
jgi:hypothetical protein